VRCEPFEAADAVADVEEASGDRMNLGLGTGVPEFLSALHSTDFKSPTKRISDCIDVLRQPWDHLAGEQVENFSGARAVSNRPKGIALDCDHPYHYL
jgi:alkanesulfonate monooxygenase SsuD/methylene tetrahydromethanopterin reductase-like flavin-dependent oxidoreductase (luciferase family)